MARAKSQPAHDELQHVDAAALEHATQAADQHRAMVAAVDATYGVGVIYNFDATIAQLQMVVANTGQLLLEMGRLLVLVREHEPAARFEEALDRTNLSPRFARRAMQAAVKFSGNQGKELLAARLGSTKLLELMSEDDVDLEVLADGGTLAGKTLDDIDRMSVRDLKTALRKERTERAADREATDAIIEKKDKKINSLDRKLKGWDRTEAREKAEQLLVGVDEHIVAALGALNKLEQTLGALFEVTHKEGLDPDLDSHIEQAVRSLGERLAEIEKQAGI